jgi:endoglucanase
MYVIIDWHFIGNVEMGFSNSTPDIKNIKEMTMDFWKQTASYFRGVPNVLFEIVNEPAGISDKRWQENANGIIQTIRSQKTNQIVIVGGTDYSSNLSWVPQINISDSAKNTAFAAHTYPGTPKNLWDNYFGKTSENFPVIMTEWGFMDENPSEDQPYINGSKDSYGIPLMNYLKARNIGWVACWYDNDWEPPMFTPDGKNYTHFGEFVIEQLKIN